MQHPDDDRRLKHSLSVNQVVVRVAGEPLGLDAGSRHVKEESFQPCGLHVDGGDVPHPRGVPLIYAYAKEEGAARVNGRPLKKNDLMIFEDESGGRCIRIQAACPDHVCIAIFSGAEHLHCNVFPNSPEPRTPGHTLLRIVPYTLRGIKKFADAVENDPELWQEVLDGDFDAGLRDRFERFAKHRASPPAR